LNLRGKKQLDTGGILRTEWNHDVRSIFFATLRNHKVKGGRWVEHVTRMKDSRMDTFRVFMLKHEGKRPFATPSCGWDNNLKRNIMKSCVPYSSGSGLAGWCEHCSRTSHSSCYMLLL
jgi:hypothetical protein